MIDVGGILGWCCDECSIIEELEHRLRMAGEYGHFQIDYCGCDKVGGEFYQCDYCEDAWSDFQNESTGRRRRTGRAYRRHMRVHKLNRKKELSKYCYGFWCESNSYIKRPKNSKYKNYLKGLANSKVRHAKEIGSGKKSYRRIYDVMWELW